jgi:hypothetical protein
VLVLRFTHSCSWFVLSLSVDSYCTNDLTFTLLLSGAPHPPTQEAEDSRKSPRPGTGTGSVVFVHVAVVSSFFVLITCFITSKCSSSVSPRVETFSDVFILAIFL